MNPWIVTIAVIVGVLAVCASFYRLRRGGPGPSRNWVPRSMRKNVNEKYEEHGWQKPYDDNGNYDEHRKLF